MIETIILDKLGKIGVGNDDTIGLSYALGWIATFRFLELKAYVAANELKELLSCQKSQQQS